MDIENFMDTEVFEKNDRYLRVKTQFFEGVLDEKFLNSVEAVNFYRDIKSLSNIEIYTLIKTYFSSLRDRKISNDSLADRLFFVFHPIEGYFIATMRNNGAKFLPEVIECITYIYKDCCTRTIRLDEKLYSRITLFWDSNLIIGEFTESVYESMLKCFDVVSHKHKCSVSLISILYGLEVIVMYSKYYKTSNKSIELLIKTRKDIKENCKGYPNSSGYLYDNKSDKELRLMMRKK
jgi:hypothetical protein